MRTAWVHNYKDFDDGKDQIPGVLTLPAVLGIVLLFAMLNYLSIAEKGIVIERAVSVAQTSEQITTIKEELNQLSLHYPVFQKLNVTSDGIRIPLKAENFFLPGTADLQYQAKVAILDVIKGLQALKSPVNVKIEGHTDSSPVVVNKWRFPTNWELSAVRAATIVRLFEEQGFPSEHLSAVGYGQHQPKHKNTDEQGQALLENQAKNRRVTILLTPPMTETGTD